MAAETFETIASDIKNRKFAPVYFFCGEEAYFIDTLIDLLEANVLSNSEKAFNQTIAYGKDLNTRQIMETCGRLPLMAEKQLVIIKEAQALSLKQEDEEQYLRYLKNPVKSTVLVFGWKHGSPDGRKSFSKEVKKAIYFESKVLYENQIVAWVKSWLNTRKYKIEEQAAELLVESTGNDLSKVANELEKLIIAKTVGTTITLDVIEREVGISKEYNVFELSKALGSKNRAKAFQILEHFLANPKNGPMIMITGTLQGFFNKIYLAHQYKNMQDKELAAVIKVSPFFVKDYRLGTKNYSEEKIEHIFYQLEEYDLRSKGLNSTNSIKDGELLKELVFRILQ
jgi:DNA polymerase-3 subunit delta